MPWRQSEQHTHSGPTLFSEINLDPEEAGRELSAHIAAESGRAKEIRASVGAPAAGGEAETAEMSIAAKRTRLDQREFGDEEAAAYKNAVLKLVADGTYRALALIHADMTHYDDLASINALGYDYASEVP